MANIARAVSAALRGKKLSSTAPPMQLLINRSINTDKPPNDDDLPAFNMENPYEKEQQQCILCKENVPIDYKNVRLLSQFQSPYTGRIYGRHITGLCKKQQEIVEAEIVKAQSAGLMATYLKSAEFLKDPKLYDVDKPIRSHRF